MIPCQIPGTNY